MKHSGRCECTARRPSRCLGWSVQTPRAAIDRSSALVARRGVMRANCVQTLQPPWYPNASTTSFSPSDAATREVLEQTWPHRRKFLQMNCKATFITVPAQRWRMCWLYSCARPLLFRRQTQASSLSTLSQPCSIMHTPAMLTIGRCGTGASRLDGLPDANSQ